MVLRVVLTKLAMPRSITCDNYRLIDVRELVGSNVDKQAALFNPGVGVPIGQARAGDITPFALTLFVEVFAEQQRGVATSSLRKIAQTRKVLWLDVATDNGGSESTREIADVCILPFLGRTHNAILLETRNIRNYSIALVGIASQPEVAGLRGTAGWLVTPSPYPASRPRPYSGRRRGSVPG